MMQPLSLGAGVLSKILNDRLRDMYVPSPSLRDGTSLAFQPQSKDEKTRLFNVSAALKIAVSQVSMHLPSEWRLRLFEKIDLLHDPEVWDDSDRLTDLESFKTFLRTILQLGALPKMSLGISPDGHILAGWRTGEDTLALEFFPQDGIRWSVVRHISGTRESASGRTSLGRISGVLQPYSPEYLFDNDNKISIS